MYRAKVVGGKKAKHGSIATILTTRTGEFRSVALRYGFSKTIKLLPRDISSVDLITSENMTSILAKTATGIAGGALLGHHGLQAGLKIGGNSHVQLCLIMLKTGEGIILEGKSKAIRPLILFGYSLAIPDGTRRVATAAPASSQEILSRIERLESSMQSVISRLDQLSR